MAILQDELGPYGSSMPMGYRKIKVDLINKLIGYAVHHSTCNVYRQDWNEGRKGGDCTCGLSDLIKEVRG